MDIYKIGVDLSSLMEDVYQVLTMVLEERLHYLSQLNFLHMKGEKLHEKVIRKDLIRLNSELVRLVKGDGDKTGVYSALSINAQGLILFHMLELVEQQGLDVLLDYFNKLHRDAKKKSSSKATKILASEGRLHRILMELRKNVEFSPENLTHPKYPVLINMILDELKKNPDSRILVFVKLRNSVKNIVRKLKDISSIRPIRFVGQATKSHDDKGLSQKRQIEILDEFRKGTYNVLVSTNVGEEGLDISECDLVIFYDVVASEIRLIQRKGRTARHRKGRVVILYSKNTRDEIYLRIALSKLKKMNVNLKNPRQLKEFYETEKENISSGEEQLEVDLEEDLIETSARNNSPMPPESRPTQSRLTSFIQETPKENTIVQTYPIKISKNLPVKFGLRNRLNEDKILSSVEDSDLHIVIHNKVLIQIYNPKNLNIESLLTEADDFKQISTLLIIILDFVEYKETIEGERRVLKRKFHALSKEHSFQVIAIDNEEELYFIIKGILDNKKEV
jgi:Fanconi anemia group M protein